MSDEFVRKDVVDEMSRRYEAQLAASEARMSRDVDRLKAAYELQRVKNKKDIDALREAVNSIRDGLNRGIAILGVIFTGLGLFIAWVQFYLTK